MRIAVPYKDEYIFNEYDKTDQFMIYDIENNHIIRKQLVDTPSNDYILLKDSLLYNNIDILVCGNIDLPEANNLMTSGINVYYGGSGNADLLINAFISQGNSSSCGCGSSSGDCGCKNNESSNNGCGCGNNEGNHSCGCGN